MHIRRLGLSAALVLTLFGCRAEGESDPVDGADGADGADGSAEWEELGDEETDGTSSSKRQGERCKGTWRKEAQGRGSSTGRVGGRHQGGQRRQGERPVRVLPVRAAVAAQLP